MPKTKIFVGHLPEGCKNSDLQALFEKYGAVTECDVINKYGFVHMSNEDEAEAAIKALNSFNLMGSCIMVEPSTSKLHPEPGAPGRAKGPGPMRGRGGGPPRNGFPPRDSYYTDSYYDDYHRFDGPPMPPRDPFFGRDSRPRPYPLPYERRVPPAPPMRDDPYSRRPLDDPYSRRIPPPPPMGAIRDDPYERRQRPPPPDYLYTRRSPPRSASVDYYDTTASAYSY